MNEVYITSAIRTAVGSLGKSLKNVKADELGSTVISESIKKSKIKPAEIDEIIFGQVLTGGSGQNPARQAAIKAGVPKEVPSYIVNQVCGSGIRSVASGFQSIKSGDSKIIIAGGQETMSLAPHAIHLRDGKKLGDAELIDTMIKDGLWDAFHGYHMGITAENVAEKFQVTREEQDKFALKSQEKALKAQKDNKFKDEIINYKIKSKNAEINFNKDEHPREGISLESLSRLKPVFKKDGTVTAGNASGINDGSAAVTLIMAQRLARKSCLDCRVLDENITPKLLNSIGFLPEQSARAKIYKGTGCEECSGSGYKGRMGIYEILEIDNELKAGILSNLQQTELNAIAKKNGFRTMQDMGQDLLLSGDLSFAEYERVLQSN